MNEWVRDFVNAGGRGGWMARVWGWVFSPWVWLGWALGTGAQLMQGRLWPWMGYGAGVFGAVLVIFWILRWRFVFASPGMRAVGALAVAAWLAFCATGWRAASFAATALGPQWQGRDVLLWGTVDSLAQANSRGGLRWLVQVRAVALPGPGLRSCQDGPQANAADHAENVWAGAGYFLGGLGDFLGVSGAGVNSSLLADLPANLPVDFPRRVALSSYFPILPSSFSGGGDMPAAPVGGLENPGVLEPGQLWCWTVRLRPTQGARNPHGWDAQLWWWTQGVLATGYVRQSGQPMWLGDSGSAPMQLWRARVRSAMQARMLGPGGGAVDVPAPVGAGVVGRDVAVKAVRAVRAGTGDVVGGSLGGVSREAGAGVVVALLTGDQAAIGREDWALLRATGVAHLVSISGLHVTMFAWGAIALVTALWRRCPLLCERWSAPVAAGWVGLAMATVYALFSGWGIPTQRTLGMLAVVLGLRAAGVVWPWWRVGLLVLALVVAWQPWSLLQAGFWLSFVAVAVLVASSGEGAAPGAGDGGRGAQGVWTDGCRGGERAGAVSALAGVSAMVVGQGAEAGAGAEGGVALSADGAWSRRAAGAQGAGAGHGAALVMPAFASVLARWAGSWRAMGAGVRWALGWCARAGLELLRTQAVLTLALLPWMVALFGQVSLVSLVANLWAVPWVTLVLTPLAVLGGVWALLWDAALWCAQLLLAVLGAMAAWPAAVVQFAQPPVWVVAVALLGCGWWVLWRRPWGVRALGLVLLLPLWWWVPARPAVGEFDVLALDVGQGSAVLLRTARHALLVDAGPQWGRPWAGDVTMGAGGAAGGDAGAQVVAPLLQALGVRLDAMLITHADGDHAGGAASVLAAQPQALLLGSGIEALAAQWGRPWRACVRGLRWQWDGVRFEVLHPGPGLVAAREAQAGQGDGSSNKISNNAMSCVLRVESARGSVALLAGDIGRAQERWLLQRSAPQGAGQGGGHDGGDGVALGDGGDLRADVLLAPHHGSASASSAAWVRAVQPGVVIFQTGRWNAYGHPAPVVVRRYEAVGSVVRNTATCGAVHWDSRWPGISRCERQLRSRYWDGGGWDAGVGGDAWDALDGGAPRQ